MSDARWIALASAVVFALVMFHYFGGRQDAVEERALAASPSAFRGRIVPVGALPGIEVDDYWMPEPKMIRALEQRMPSFSMQSALTFCTQRRAAFFADIREFEIEYTGFVRDAERLIYVYFRVSPRLAETLGVRPIAAVFDPASSEFVELVWNASECEGLGVDLDLSRLAQQKEEEAHRAALQWLARVDAGEYQLSWYDASLRIRADFTAYQWEQLLVVSRGEAGALLSRERLDARYSIATGPATSVERTVIRYRTRFENMAGLETVTLDLEADYEGGNEYGVWKITGYVMR